jgi:hypothetical protein
MTAPAAVIVEAQVGARKCPRRVLLPTIAIEHLFG